MIYGIRFEISHLHTATLSEELSKHSRAKATQRHAYQIDGTWETEEFQV